MDAPGLFFYLVRDGVLTLDALAPLLERLPPERIVVSGARDGEAFDSTRWPLARDAALATVIARRTADPQVLAALVELDAAAADLPRLHTLARTALARLFAASGADADLFSRLGPTTPVELAVFDQSRWPVATAQFVADLCHTHHAAADGLYAYHVHRGLPGPSAESAARLARRAIDDGLLPAADLVTAAIALLDRHPTTTSDHVLKSMFFGTPHAAAAERLAATLAAACSKVAPLTGASGLWVLGEHFAIPTAPERVDYLIAAGPRAIVAVRFDVVPPWTGRVRAFRALPLFTRYTGPTPELILPPVEREGDRAPAALASLCFFVEVSLDAHLAGHPEDDAVFPVLDDAALDRLFGR